MSTHLLMIKMKKMDGKKKVTLLTSGGIFLWILLSAYVYVTNVQLSEEQSGVNTKYSLPRLGRSLPDYCPNVDVVFTWVNGTDPKQLALLGKYVKNPQKMNIMFRDYGMLRFGIRSVEKFMPWIRKIYLFTNGQVPTWFNTSAERGIIVTHEQVFTNKTNLPTFNSNAIESHIRLIPGISDCIVYLNDDFFIGTPTPKSFFVNPITGKLRLFFDGFSAPEEKEMKKNGWHKSVGYTNTLINAHYHPDATKVVRHNYAGHYCYFFKKEILDKMGATWPNEFAFTTNNKFREHKDIAVPFMHHNIALEEGIGSKARGKNGGGSWRSNHTENVQTWNKLMSKPKHCLCIQDRLDNVPETEVEIRYLEELMCSLFPEKSSLELSTDFNPCIKYEE